MYFVLHLGTSFMHQPPVVTAYYLHEDKLRSQTLRIAKRPREKDFNLQDQTLLGRPIDSSAAAAVKQWCTDNQDILLNYWSGNLNWNEFNQHFKESDGSSCVSFFTQTELFQVLSDADKNRFLCDPTYSGYLFRRKIIELACISAKALACEK